MYVSEYKKILTTLSSLVIISGDDKGGILIMRKINQYSKYAITCIVKI